MAKNTKQAVSIILLILGSLIFLYGFNLHIRPVFSEDNDKGFATQERQLVFEVSIGGLKRESDGRLHKTYMGAPPSACPT